MTDQAPMPDDRRPPQLAVDSPTELVETDDGDLVERLSGRTATMLLVWLIGVGAGSALLATWIFAAVVLNRHLGIGALFSGLGFYVGLFGASGPTILWLAGRAHDHSFGWFLLTAAKMGVVMIGIVIAVTAVSTLILGGALGIGALLIAAILLVVTLVLALIWALATWSADRYIARARVDAGES